MGDDYRSPDGVHELTKKNTDVLGNLSPACKVASCLDLTEYLALSDAAKDGVKIVLSCGFVDMRDGEWARNTLFAIFDAQSTTRANLITMFG